MNETTDNIKKNKLIAFVGNLDGNQEDLFLNDNILLRKTTEKEKEDFLNYNHNSDLENCEIEHCFEFILNDEFIERIEAEELSYEDFEYGVLSEAVWCFLKMGEAINISKDHPCEVLRIDLINNKYIPNYSDNFGLSPKPKYFEDIMVVIEKEDIKTINSVFLLLLEVTRDINKIDYKKNWWIIPSEYYSRHDESISTADQIINLMIGLESLLSYENTEISFRLRLRSSLYLYHIDHYHPGQVQQIIKEMYNLRSKIVHGVVSLDNPSSAEITYFPGTQKTPPVKIDILLARRMLRNILRIMLLDVLLNHTTQSKKEFIEYIDGIWYEDMDESKINIIPDYEVVYGLK
jgi:hypothetical protein